MSNSSKICIIGAGAIGCTLAARLILAGQQQVSLIARGENLQYLLEHGIHLTDLYGEHQVYPYALLADIRSLAAQDYIFICTKFNAIKQVCDQLNSVLHSETVIIPLMNGIPFWYFYQGEAEPQNIQAIHCLDQERYLIEHFPLAHLIGAVVFIVAQLKHYGTVLSTNPYLLILGEPTQKISPRLQKLQALFENSAIEARVVENIRDQIWTKVIANLSSNPLSVITGATLKDIYSHPKLQHIVIEMMQEIRLVAASYGASIHIDPDTFLQLCAEMGEVYTSMWQDYQHKRPLELNSIASAVFELAQRYQCQMPMTQNICNLTHYLSEQSLRSKEEN